MQDDNPMLLMLVTGSRLYRLDHADSDVDRYAVHMQSAKPRQRIVDDNDTLTLGWPQFVEQATRGVPQAMEAMFAPADAVTVDLLPGFRAGFRVAGFEAMDRVRRTIASFFRDGGTKRRRHALRLAFAYAELRERGRFNPRLSDHQCARVLGVDHVDDAELAGWINAVCGEDVIHDAPARPTM